MKKRFWLNSFALVFSLSVLFFMLTCKYIDHRRIKKMHERDAEKARRARSAGDYNVGIGYSVGPSMETDSGNTFIGGRMKEEENHGNLGATDQRDH